MTGYVFVWTLTDVLQVGACVLLALLFVGVYMWDWCERWHRRDRG